MKDCRENYLLLLQYTVICQAEGRCNFEEQFGGTNLTAFTRLVKLE